MTSKPKAQFPRTLLVRIENEGDGSYPVAAELPDELGSEQGERAARYVFAGTGTIQHVAPQYVEDTPKA